MFAGSLKVVDTPKTIPSPGTTGWGGLVGWTTGGAGAVGGKTIFNNCRQLGTVEKENLDLSKETTFGQFIGYANGNTILSGDNYMNTDNVGFKWSDSVGSEGRGKTGYGDLATIIDKQIAVPAVRICLEGEDVKSLDNPKVACHSLTTKESIVTLKAGEELTIDCAIGDAYVVDSSGNKIDGVSAGGTSKKYVGK